MQYIRVNWIHDFATEPVALFSELDDDRWEVRKVEVFRNGDMTFANRQTSTGSTSVPRIIDQEAFEAIWTQACAKARRDAVGGRTP